MLLVPIIAGFGSADALARKPAPPVAVANGPAADYPVVIGEPYKIGSTLYTPADTMNYDAVGHAAADGGSGVTGSHRTLPLPSYVEVTSLETGRTILVRLERRGPMSGDDVIALSPAALAQLGAAAGAPVRVRRVNPPEEERAMLRAGHSAPKRMDTPASLVAVLARKLSGTNLAPLAPKPAPSAVAAVELPPSAAVQRALPPSAVTAHPTGARNAPPPLPPLPARISQPAAAPGPAPVVVARLTEPPRATAPSVTAPARTAADPSGRFLVQAAAMSTFDRAAKVAGAIGGSVSKSGQYYRVHTGPFATRGQAEASLAKVRGAGYSDARIYTNG